jgi:hypothetical protein
MASAGVCFDYLGNPVDCGSSDASASFMPTAGQLAATDAAGTGSNPIALSAATSNGPNPGILGSVLNFTAAVTPFISKIVAPSPASGLRLQTNPATGQQQYFNPTTGQYVGGAVNTGGLTGFFSGNSGFLLVVAALVVAFFAFGGRKRFLSA